MRRQVEDWGREVAGSEDPFQAICKLARRENLSAKNVDYVCKSANRQILVGLQKKAVAENGNPHATFPLLTAPRVLALIRTPPKPTAVAVTLAQSKIQDVVAKGKLTLEEMDAQERVLSTRRARLSTKRDELRSSLVELMRAFLRQGHPIEVLEQIDRCHDLVEQARRDVVRERFTIKSASIVSVDPAHPFLRKFSEYEHACAEADAVEEEHDALKLQIKIALRNRGRS